MISEHCPECKGSGRELYFSDGYERVSAIVCLNCKGSGIVEISDFELERRRLERERYEEKRKEEKKREEEETPRKDKENLVASIGFGVLGGVIGFFVGGIIANIAFQIIRVASLIFGNSIADDEGKIFITIVTILGIGVGGFVGYHEKRTDIYKRRA